MKQRSLTFNISYRLSSIKLCKSCKILYLFILYCLKDFSLEDFLKHREISLPQNLNPQRVSIFLNLRKLILT